MKCDEENGYIHVDREREKGRRGWGTELSKTLFTAQNRERLLGGVEGREKALSPGGLKGTTSKINSAILNPNRTKPPREKKGLFGENRCARPMFALLVLNEQATTTKVPKGTSKVIIKFERP